MKYIFLDIDGVLNYSGDNDLIENTISKKRLDLFIKLVNETNANVVIISSRRCYLEDRNQLLRILDDIYYNLSFISTKVLSRYRADEIRMYLDSNPCESYIILDDVDCNYSLNPIINPHFIEVKHGFNEETYIKAIKLL